MKFNWKEEGFLWYFAEERNTTAEGLMRSTQDELSINEIEKLYARNFILGKPSTDKIGDIFYAQDIEVIKEVITGEIYDSSVRDFDENAEAIAKLKSTLAKQGFMPNPFNNKTQSESDDAQLSEEQKK
ncbi:hypothetical protein V7166_17515 [Bacillus thuringiensis]